LGKWRDIWVIYVLYGFGRLTWENTAKAIFADFFTGKDRTSAFSNLNFAIGLSSTVFAFVVGDFGKVDLSIAIIVPAAAIVPCFYLSSSLPSSYHFTDSLKEILA
jgi:hypothetical protein